MQPSSVPTAESEAPSLRAAIRDWTIAQILEAQRISIEPTAGGGSAFIAHVTLYSAALGVAISQACYATGNNHERAVLRQLLGELDLDGVLIQADGLHTQKSFSAAPAAGGRLPADSPRRSVPCQSG